jgi:hypothetical protein
MAADDILERGKGEWLKARVRRDLGGFFPQPHGNFPKKTPRLASLPDWRHHFTGPNKSPLPGLT